MTQTERLRAAEARYLELAKIIRELKEKNAELEASLKRQQERNKNLKLKIKGLTP